MNKYFYFFYFSQKVEKYIITTAEVNCRQRQENRLTYAHIINNNKKHYVKKQIVKKKYQ